MTTPMNDDDMLGLLAESLTDDQPPAAALELAYASFGWRTLETDLARLIDDSQVEVVGFRQGAYSRLLTYDSALGTIEVGLADDAFEVMAVPAAEQIQVVRSSSTDPLELDADGRARGSGLPGPVRFEVRWPTGSVVTPWLTL